MRIVQVITQMEGGGSQRTAILNARGMRSAGHQVTTCFMFRKRGVYDDEPETVCISERPPQSALDYVRILWMLFRFISREKPDAVLTFTHYANVFGCTFAALCGVRRRVARQTGLPQKNPLLARVLDYAVGSIGVYTHNVANSATTRTAFGRYPDRYRRRMETIPNGVEIKSPSRPKNDVRAEYDIPEDGFVVLNVGRLSYVKNQLRLLNAVSKVPDVFLVIAGDGEDREKIEHEIVALGLSHRVTLLGDVKSDLLCDIYGLADAFVFPSIWESFGIAVIEAASSGLPLAISDIPAFVETTGGRDAGNALYFDPSSTDEIVTAISSLRDDDVLRRTLGNRARLLAEPFKPEVMTGKFLSLIGEGAGI